MSLIALWSPLSGGSGSTVLACSLSIMLSMEYKAACLLMHGGKMRSRVEQAFPGVNNVTETIYDDGNQGMSALHRLAVCGRLSQHNFKDYASTVIPDRMHFMKGTPEPLLLRDEAEVHTYRTILNAAVQSYDVVVADAGNGRPEGMDLELIMSADLLLIGLNQNMHALDEQFENKLYGIPEQVKSFGYVVGRYDTDSHYTLQNIRRKFGLKEFIEKVPYSSNIADAWNSRSITACLLRGQGGMKHKRETAFNQAVRSISSLASDTVGMPGLRNSVERGA
ncbi:hypothetical protein [Paenibacillus lemnae]|uniref:ParA family protein n=1 Tax=Paenibacillus lemnae TaxID=1330551 RepID=A0A848M8X2_PAELE|nr:hypothetical protein [Paenibacillus lemnae]NMO95954.1 hypothetical protein [Paenibacillus lemnae]